MKEAIIKLTSDHIKVKGAEYVRDLVRCKDCKHGTWHEQAEMYICNANDQDLYEAEHFCSYGEVRDE